MLLEILQNSQGKACARVSMAQLFSCEFCEIAKSTFFTEHIWATGSEYGKICWSGEGFNKGFQEFQEICDRMKGKRGKTYY